MPSQIDRPESSRQLLPPRSTEAVGYTESSPRSAREFLEDASRGGLLEYWGILRRHKGAVLLFAFLGVVAAVLVTLPQTPVYQARASLEIQSMNQDFMNAKQLNPVTEQESSASDIQTHIKLLQSETLLQRVVDKLAKSQPQDLYQPTDRISIWRRALNLPQPKPADAREQALKLAKSSLKLRAAGMTRVVEILSDSTDPRLAAAFANTLANEYIDQSMESRWQMNQRTGEFLGRQLDDMRIKLERSEDQLQRYAAQAGLLFTGDKDKQNVSEEKLRQLQQELSKAQGERISKQSRYEMAQTAQPESLADVLNDTSLRDYQSKLTDLRRQEAELSATYRPEYSKVLRIKAQIVTLDTALVRERKAITERIRNDYQEAQRREKLLTADYTSQAKLVTTESGKSIQYNILKREVDTTRQLYEGMIQRVKESGIASAMRASNVRIVDIADTPKLPYKPSLPINGMLGLLAGLFLGVAFVMVRERADRTIQSPGDAVFYLNIPELGVIPQAGSHSRRLLVYGRHRQKLTAAPLPPNVDLAVDPANVDLAESRVGPRPANVEVVLQPSKVVTQLAGAGIQPANIAALTEPRPLGSVPIPQRSNGPLGLNLAANNPQERIELITLQRKQSMAAEAFRVVLTSILFSGENGGRPRVLVMTSAGPNEGKTTVSSNLAIALSEIHRKTLLVDADLRKPRIHQIFNLPNERGLSTLLTERTLGEDALRGMVQETSIPDLFVLTSGPAAGAGLLHSPILPDLLKRFKREFDMVVIDTPPMLQMPDARVVGRYADAVIMVLRAGQTTRDAAVAARERLTEDGTRVLGTILNDWNPKQSPNGYYGYSSGYGYDGGNGNQYYTAKKDE